MNDRPHALSLHRKLARKLPRRVRRTFVRTVDTRLKPAGKHHSGAPRCDMTIPEAQSLTEMAEDLATGARDWAEWDPDLTSRRRPRRKSRQRKPLRRHGRRGSSWA